MTGVIHVVTALERGGAQRVVLETAARLHHPGRPQLVVTGPRAGGEGALDDEAERRLGRRLLRLKSLAGPVDPVRDTLCVLDLARLIDREVSRLGSPVVVHTHSSKAGVVGRLAARAVRGVYSVHTVHGFGLDALGEKHRWVLEAAERASSVCDVAVFVSEADRAAASRLGLFRDARHEVIRAGVDVAAFAGVAGDPARRREALERFFTPLPARGSPVDGARDRLLRVGVHDVAVAGERLRGAVAKGLSSEASRRSPWPQPRGPVAVTVGNLKAQKDPLFHLEVLRAWAERRASGARAAGAARTPSRGAPRRAPEGSPRLLFAGDGPLRDDVAGRARELGLDGALALPGFLEDPRDALAAGDVFLLASAWEGLPCSVVEALAAGLPCVVRDTGYAADLAWAKKAVRALPHDAPPEAFAAALDDVVGAPPRIPKVPRAFTVAGMLQALSRLYDELIGPPRPTGPLFGRRRAGRGSASRASRRR